MVVELKSKKCTSDEGCPTFFTTVVIVILLAECRLTFQQKGASQ